MAEFWEQMNTQFGPAYAESVAKDHVCARLAGRTPAQAVEEGEPYKTVWLAICADFDLPAGSADGLPGPRNGYGVSRMIEHLFG